ncbi:MAG: hypothetical protein FJ087_16860 [Deltaproteobacteria bacterium]|nr:hypothetical protein [Deltaproteobacteria bacterium]
MMDIRKIRPRPGLVIMFPAPPYAPIAADGIRVEFPGPESYWVRRLAAGEIEVVPDTDAEPVKAKRAKED